MHIHVRVYMRAYRCLDRDDYAGAYIRTCTYMYACVRTHMHIHVRVYMRAYRCLDRDDYAGAAALKKLIDERIGRPRR